MNKCNSFCKAAFLVCAAFWQLSTVSALDYYWVGGSGLWSDHNNHWATTSGGAVFHDQVPQSMDNVFFDANSFPAGGTVTIDQTIIYCMDMDWTGAGNVPVLFGPNDRQVWIYGSLTLIVGMEWEVQGEVHFRAFQGGKTITSAEKEFSNQVFFDGAGGGWTLLDALWIHQYLQHLDGALFTNGQEVRVDYGFYSNGTMLQFGSSNIYITGVNISCPSFANIASNFDAGTSTIHMQYPNEGCGDSFHGGNHTYHNLVCEASTHIFGDNNFYSATFIKGAEINGSNHYDILTLTPGQLYKLAGGSTQTINPGGAFNSNGTCIDFLTIVSTLTGSAAQIEKTTGAVILDYVVLQDVHAIGGATFSTTNSADLGNNFGWTFLPVSPRNLYWVGGGGNWNDALHWSLLSGGAGGECIPTPFDNVFFDQNSGFTLPGEQVIIHVSPAFCQDMDWTNVLNVPDFAGASQNKIFVFGSLKFASNMTLSFLGEVHFMAHTIGKTITSAGKEFLNSVFFDGAGGGWTLLDALWIHQYLQHLDGALFTNGQEVRVDYGFYSNGTMLQFGSSNIYITGVNISCPSFANIASNFDAGTSTIHMQYPNEGCGDSFHGGNHTYHNLVCEASTHIFGDNNFYSATFMKGAKINSNNVFESLAFHPGYTYELSVGSTQTITPLGNFTALGTGGFPVEIKSSQLGTQANFHKDGDPICLDYLYLTDIAATGSSFTYAGANSDDVFNNSGWIFEACPGCFTALPLPAPVLDPASVTIVQPGQQATLILQNLPTGYEVVWLDANQATELYASTTNLFDPLVNGSTTFYAAFRELATGCVSEVLKVNVCAATLEIVSQTNPSCADNDGQININLIGATAPYSFSWTTVDGSGLNPTAEDQTTLGGGTYQVVATDINGCTASAMTFLMAAEDNNSLPPGWSHNDVGNANGTAILSPCTGAFVLTANGFSTSSSDVLHTAYQQICGNTQVTARVLTLSGGGWGGVMIRETLTPGSKKVGLKTQLTSIIRREIRTTTNGAASILNFNRPQHTWLRLVRTGSTFVAYTSPDGTNWTFAFSATVNMAGCVYVGIFAESINNNTTTTATFDNVSVTGTPLPVLSVSNQPPVAESGDHVQIYPNPTTGEVNINLNIHAGKPGIIQVFNTLGELVTQERLITSNLETHRLRIAGSVGVYTVAIQLDDRRIVRRVVVDGND